LNFQRVTVMYYTRAILLFVLIELFPTVSSKILANNKIWMDREKNEVFFRVARGCTRHMSEREHLC
jgi:hypothetical protein